jgi:hypothetical protein
MVQQNPAVRTASDFFMSRGYSYAQAAGIIGNLMGESSLNTGAVGDGGLAKGIAQWHPDRWQPLVSWAQSQGKDPYDLTTQLEMVDYELRTKEVRSFNALMGCQDGGRRDHCLHRLRAAPWMDTGEPQWRA